MKFFCPIVKQGSAVILNKTEKRPESVTKTFAGKEVKEEPPPPHKKKKKEKKKK